LQIRVHRGFAITSHATIVVYVHGGSSYSGVLNYNNSEEYLDFTTSLNRLILFLSCALLFPNTTR